MVRSERRIGVRSGELVVGMLSRETHGPEHWLWALTGVHRPDDEHFVWHGEAETEQQAFEALERCWSQWLAWAGLEQVGDLQRGVKPR